MADGALSQEDIDALLGGGSFGGGESSSGGDSSDDPFAGMNLGGGDGPSSDAIAAAPRMAALAPSSPLIRNLALPLYKESTCSLYASSIGRKSRSPAWLPPRPIGAW